MGVWTEESESSSSLAWGVAREIHTILLKLFDGRVDCGVIELFNLDQRF